MMSVQRKAFIRPSDILSILCECEYCHVTVSIPITAEAEVGTLKSCPNCKELWTALENKDGLTLEGGIMNFFNGLRKLRDGIFRIEASPKNKGFTLSLEIRAPEIISGVQGVSTPQGKR